MENFAKEVNGEFSAYDKSKSVIIIPLPENRFQTIVGLLRLNEIQEREIIAFSTVVCKLQPEINLEKLLRANAGFCHARFSISDETIKVEASVHLDNVTGEMLKEIILEVARIADEWELRLTGIDIH